jgi:hypothetical protein
MCMYELLFAVLLSVDAAVVVVPCEQLCTAQRQAVLMTHENSKFYSYTLQRSILTAVECVVEGLRLVCSTSN